MTCRHALSLLEDYMDSNLASPTAFEVKAHLDACPECRGEYEETLRLKELLKTPVTSTVADSYWSEVSSLIAAKTVEADASLPARSPSITQISSDRRELFRSAMAFAASICILFTALYLGSLRNQQSSHFNNPHSTILVAATLREVVGDDDGAVITNREYATMMGSRFLMGMPGPLGRALGPLDLLTF
ncbi:MAG: zf-HC2 domain-containing protein [Candidatus Zixiibacteriota bacterium]